MLPLPEPLQEATDTPVLHESTTLPEATGCIPSATSTAPPGEPLQEATVSDQGNTLSKYYFCMSPGGTEVLYLHHDDIVRNKCTVQLDKLRPGDIPVASKDISSSSINETTDKDSTQYGTKSDPDWNNRTKKKRSFKPRSRRMPSKSRMAAQRIIKANNRRKNHRKTSTPTKIMLSGLVVPKPDTLPEATPTTSTTEPHVSDAETQCKVYLFCGCCEGLSYG